MDADYTFIIVDIGNYGCNSDGGTFVEFQLGKHLRDKALHFPTDKALSNQAPPHPMPHVIVRDSAFPLNTYLMKPYPNWQLPGDRLLFNYRLTMVWGSWKMVLVFIYNDGEYTIYTI